MRAVAAHGSFRAAAVALGFTQGALSQQIATLEHRIGSRLVDRRAGVRRVVLTAAGELLLQHAHRILDGVAEARTALGGAEERPEPLRVGAVATLRALLGDAVARLLAQVAAEVELAGDGGGGALVEAVGAGRLDLAIVEDWRPQKGLRADMLHVDPFVALVPAGSPEAERPIPLEQLAATRLFGLPRTCDSAARLEDAAAELGSPLTVAVRAEDPEILRRLVLRAGGCALLPRLAVPAAAGCALRPVDRRLPPRMVSVVRREGASRAPAADALLAELHAVVAARVPVEAEPRAGPRAVRA